MNIPLTVDAEIEPYVACFLMQGSVHMITTRIENGYDIPPKRLASLIYELCSRTAPGKP